MEREYQPLEEEKRRTYLLYYYYYYYPEGDAPGTSPSSSSPIGFKEVKLLKELFGDHFFDKGAKDLKDEQVVRILLRLKASMKRSISMKCLLPHLKKFKILMESEVEYLSSSIYEPSEQAVRLIEYLMNLGSYGLATLYLSLMESSKEKLSPPAHYVLLGEIKEAGDGLAHVFMNTRLRVDSKGTPHRSLDSSRSRYASMTTTSGPAKPPRRVADMTRLPRLDLLGSDSSSLVSRQSHFSVPLSPKKGGLEPVGSYRNREPSIVLLESDSEEEEDKEGGMEVESSGAEDMPELLVEAEDQPSGKEIQPAGVERHPTGMENQAIAMENQQTAMEVQPTGVESQPAGMEMRLQESVDTESESSQSESADQSAVDGDASLNLEMAATGPPGESVVAPSDMNTDLSMPAVDIDTSQHDSNEDGKAGVGASVAPANNVAISQLVDINDTAETNDTADPSLATHDSGDQRPALISTSSVLIDITTTTPIRSSGRFSPSDDSISSSSSKKDLPRGVKVLKPGRVTTGTSDEGMASSTDHTHLSQSHAHPRFGKANLSLVFPVLYQSVMEYCSGEGGESSVGDQQKQQLSGSSGGDIGDNRALGDALDILNEFVQISVLAAIGVGEDGQEYLTELATRSGLENIEGFFLSYFFQTEELLRTNRLFTNFMAGMPSPFLFLLQQNVLTKNDFYKVLRDMGRDNFPNQFALALHQFPGSDHLAYDGEVIFSSMFMQHLVFGMRQNSLGLAFQSGPSSLPTPQRDSRPPPSRPAITSGRKTEEAPVSKPQERAGGSARDVSHSKPVESARREQPTGGISGNRLGGGERSRSRLLDRDGGQLSPPRPSESAGDQTASQQATNSLPTSLGSGEVQSVGVAPSASWPLPASGPAHAQSDAVATPPSSSGIDTPPTSAGLVTPSAGSATPPTALATPPASSATPPTSSVPAMPPPSSLTTLSDSATLPANSGQEYQFETSPASTALVTATAATSILTSTSSTFTTPPVRSTEVVSMATASVPAAPLVKSAEASSQEVMESNDLDQEVTITRSEVRRTEEVVRASLTGGRSEGGMPVYTQAMPTSSQAMPTPPMAATCVSNSRPTHTCAAAVSTNLHVVTASAPLTSEPVSFPPTQIPTVYAQRASGFANPLPTSIQGTILSLQHPTTYLPNMVENRSLHHLLPTHGHPSAVPSPLNVPYVPPQPYVHVMQPSPSTHAQSQYYPLPTSAVPPSLIPAHIPTSVVQPSIGIHPSRPAITSGRKTEEAPVSKPQERAGGSARDVSHSKPVESARRDQPTGGRSGNRLGGRERSRRSRLLDRDGGQLSSPRPPSEREGDQTASQQATNSLPISLGGEEMHSVGVAPSASWPLPASGPAHAQFDAVATPPSSTPPTSAGLTTPSASSATPPTTLATPPTSSVPAMPPPSSLTKLSGSATLRANSGQESQFEAPPASTALVTATAATSILTFTSSTFTTPPVRSTEVVSMATASVSAAPLVKSAEASSQEVIEPNDLDKEVTITRSEERRTEEVVRASLTGGRSEGGVPVYTQAVPTFSQATPTPPMAATCVSNSRPTHTFAVAASTNLHVVVSAMTSEPVSVLPTQVPTAYAPQASDVAHPLLTSTQGTISIQHSLPPNMVADQSLHHSLPTNGHPSAMPSPLDPPHVPSSQPSVHVMQSSPLTSLYYPPTSAAPPSLTPAHILTPLTHAQSHFMLGSNYSSTPSFSASNLSSKQTMTSSFGTSTSPSPPIPHQSSSSLNEPMQSRLPPSDSTSESHLTPPVQPGDRSLRGGEEGEDGVSSCVSLEDRRITEDFTLSQHVSYTEQWKALRSKGTASVKNKGGSLKSKSSLQIRSVTSSLPVMREGVLRREGIGSAKASLRGKGSSTSSLPVVLGKENKITFPLSERRSLESTLLKHRHSPRATKVRPGGFSESPLHISATSSTTTVARKPLPSRIPRLVRKGKERKSDDLSSTSTDTLMEDTGTTSSSRPASAKKSSPVKRGPSFLPASTRRRPHTEPLRRIARPACANIRVSAGPDYVPSRIQPDGGIMEYPVFDRSTRPAKLKLHDADDRTTNIVPQRFYKTPSQRKYYSMKALKHGIALIINNRNFKNSKAYPVREGTERDEYNLIQTFYYLGYRPVVCNDLNSAKVCYIFENLDSFLADSGASTKTANDSFVCCILSHGTKDSIIGSDSQPIPRDYIEQQTGRSLILNGKPKIFFMQACRGRDYGSEPVPTYRVQADGGDSDRADLYVCCAAVSGDKSFRDTLLGSWFITELCKILCEFGTCHNLNEIQTKLNAEVPQNPAYMIEAKDGKWHVQQPTCSNNTLKHDVHFFHK